MRFALVSDIHANLQAWNATLLDIRSQGIDQIICMGDILGYGPSPAEVLQSAYENIDHFVLGNHDAVVCDKLDTDLFNDEAAAIIEWTRDQLTEDALTFLNTIPLSLNAGLFRCAHGDFSNPSAFNYIIEPEEAIPSWESVPEQLLFVGHSHCPGIYLLGQSGIPRLTDPQDFVLEPDKRFLVNVGSVGQPRDGDARSAYCILDAEQQSVHWRRIPFDIDSYAAALAEKSISSRPSYFLNYDPRNEHPPLRDMLNFSPAATPAQEAQNSIEVMSVDLLEKRARSWRRRCMAATSVLLATGAIITATMLRHAQRDQLLAGAAHMRVSSLAAPPNLNLLPSIPEATGTADVVAGWDLQLGNRYKQTITTSVITDAESGSTHAFTIQSRDAGRSIIISSPILTTRPGMKLCSEAMIQRQADFHGTVVLAVVAYRTLDNGRVERLTNFVVKEPTLKRRDNWWLAKHTFTVPANCSQLVCEVRGDFTGTLLVRDIFLTRRD